MERQVRTETLRADAAQEEARAWRAEAELRGQTKSQAWAVANEFHRHSATIEASTAWRASGPFRNFGSHHPGTARLLRRTLKATWWAATRQLRARLRARRQAVPPASREHLDVLPATIPTPELPQLAPAQPNPAAIDVPTAADPVVSVIIPAYGHVDFTLRCLASIAEHLPRTPIEVIVMEDASGDPDVARLDWVTGILLIRNARNMGFLATCNAGAKAARGRYLLFLNNDTEVRPGAVDALADLLTASADRRRSSAGPAARSRPPAVTSVRHCRRARRGGADARRYGPPRRRGPLRHLVSATPSGGWLQSSPTIPALGWPLGSRAQMFWLEEGLASSLVPGKRPRTTSPPGSCCAAASPGLPTARPAATSRSSGRCMRPPPRRPRARPAGGDRRAGVAHRPPDLVVGSTGFAPRSLAVESRFGRR